MAEHRERQRLMPVGLERGERVAHVLAGAGVALGPLAIDPVVEVQNTPTDRRSHAFHGVERTRDRRSRACDATSVVGSPSDVSSTVAGQAALP